MGIWNKDSSEGLEPWPDEIDDWPGKIEQPKFSQCLTSSPIAITVGKSKTFYLHLDLLVAESERFSKSLTGSFKEAEEKAIELVDEDPELFGFFVEYLYRNRSIFSHRVGRCSDFVTLARLYALGERLVAPSFKMYSFLRFVEKLDSKRGPLPTRVCELLHVACTEIAERVEEDPIRAQIFWYAGTQITALQKTGTFRQLLRDNPDLGRHLCLWVGQDQPTKPKVTASDFDLLGANFEPESVPHIELL